jgi:DNA-binding response OmpR family regulator
VTSVIAGPPGVPGVLKVAGPAPDTDVMQTTTPAGNGATIARTAAATAVLLVEDDERISEPLIRVLRAEGFDVEHVANGRRAIDAIADGRPDLVLLDLTLPDVDGLDVCRKIRADHPNLPVIMLTARAEEMDVIVGLNAGADDYVAKPFRLAELVARIRARLRIADQRGTTTATGGRLTGAGIELDVEARRCFITGADAVRTEIELTTKEFDLLALLMRQPGVTLKREHIMSAVWDENWWGSTRTLDTHTSTLRRKILDLTDPPSKIVTVRGVGFRFDPGTG